MVLTIITVVMCLLSFPLAVLAASVSYTHLTLPTIYSV